MVLYTKRSTTNTTTEITETKMGGILTTNKKRTGCNGNVTGLHIDPICNNVTVLVHVTEM